ncbi:hypothetical protein ACIRBZ_45325 [Streptomyces sp. NPDC094038]|uniref:hypothetical protein n=1 Tax=Streptomyces sp. NPDC094038 TaxID=3366055 RepID=UPI00382B21B4
MGIPLVRTEDGSSPRAGLDPLVKAPEHAVEVAEAFQSFGYTQAVVPDPCTDYLALVEQALLAEEVDVLIVHIVGHGELADGRSEKLYVLDGQGARLHASVERWIEQIEDHPEEHRPTTLFILDVCYAGEAALTQWHTRMDIAERRAWVMAATGPRDEAFGYRLSRALVRVLKRYRDLEVRFDPSVRYIPPSTVWREIEGAVNILVEEDQGLKQKILTSLVPGHADLSHLPFFPNPSFEEPGRTGPGLAAHRSPEMARLANWGVDPEHFIRRAGGGEPAARHQDESYFSGRKEELQHLSTWLDDETAAPGLHIVTGKPGVGKSALLGVLVCAAHPALRQLTRRLWHGLEASTPGENERIAVIHARRLGLDQIVGLLARQLRHIASPEQQPEPDNEQDESAANPADHLLNLLPDDGRPVTVIIDALDEAVRPEDITMTLLLPLAQQMQTTGTRLRLLVGTREDERFHQLLALARRQDACTDLSTTPPHSASQAVADYVSRLLTADGPYAHAARRAARQALARAIAEHLTGHGGAGENAAALQWGEFLTAGLYVHYLLAHEEPRDLPEDAAELGRAVPRDLPTLLELDLKRPTVQPLLRPVLTALAFAQGRGMPEHALAHAAAAFTNIPADDRPIPHQELYRLLDHEARFYLRRDVDVDGTTLYRLFHEGLAEWLRHSAQSEVPAQNVPSAAGILSTPAERLYQRLMECVPCDSAGRKLWHLAVPYLRRHATQHAIDAGLLDGLLQDGSFLVYADPHAVEDSLRHATSQQARLNAAVYRASWDVHHVLPPAARRQVLALDAARFRNEPLQSDLPGDTDWRVRWATNSQVSTALVRTLVGHTDRVTAVAVVWLEGRPHAVTGGHDQTVRVWDLATGKNTHVLCGHTDRITAVWTAELNDRPHVVACDDRSVLVWDLTTGNLVHQLTGPRYRFSSAVIAEVEGRPHAVIGNAVGEVLVWDLITGQQVHQLVGLTDLSAAVAVAVLDGRPHVVASDGRSAAVWEMTTGHRIHQLDSRSDPVRAVAVAVLEGRPHAVVSDGRSMFVWDLTTGKQIHQIGDHPARITAIAVADIRGRPHAVAGNHTGEISVWDLSTGALAYRLNGRTDLVDAVAVVEVGDRPHAVTVTDSITGAVRVWDLATQQDLDNPPGHAAPVSEVAVVGAESSRHAFTSSEDSAVRIWDLATGQQSYLVTRDTPEIKTIVALEDFPFAVSCSKTGSVAVWDLATRERTQLIEDISLLSLGACAVAAAVMEGCPLAVTNHRGAVRVWDLTTKEEIYRLTVDRLWAGGGSEMAVAEVPDSPCVVTAYGKKALVWDLTTGQPLHEFTAHTGRVTAVTATKVHGIPHAVTSDGSSVLVWDVSTGQQLHSLAGHSGEVTAVAVTNVKDRAISVTGSDDRSVRAWDLTTGSCLATFHLPDSVSAIAAGSDGTVLLGVGHEVVALSLNLIGKRP